MSMPKSQRAPHSRDRRAAWIFPSAAILLATVGCSDQKPPTPPNTEPSAGIILKLSAGPNFRASLIKAVDFAFDAAPGGPSLGLTEDAEIPLVDQGTRYDIEQRNVDTDDDAELLGTINGNPFGDDGKTAVEVFVPTPAEITTEGVPFELRLSARGVAGTLSAATYRKNADGTPYTFPIKGRTTITVAYPCMTNVSCITAANRPPVVAPFGTTPMTIRRWWPIEIKPYAYDPDGDPITYSVAPEDLAALPGGNATFDAATRTFTWTPPSEALNFMGKDSMGNPNRVKPSWKIRFRATDNHGGTSEGTALIDVVQPNSNPIWQPVPPQTVVEETELVIQLSVKDPDGEPIDFELDTVKLPPGANADFDEDLGLFSWTPTYDDARARPYLARIYARDQNDGSALLEIPITVVDSNRPPRFTTPPSTTFKAGVAGSFRTSWDDLDGDPVSVTPEPVAFPTGAHPSYDRATGIFTWTPTAADARAAPYLVRFYARDNRGGETIVTTNITVSADNSAPVLSVPQPPIVIEGQPLAFSVTATDPEGDAVEITADTSGLPTGNGATFTGGTFRWQPAYGMARSEPWRLSFTARDAKNASVTATVLVQVRPFVPGAPSAPIFTATDPVSPANNNDPVIKGTSEPHNVITLYANADCSGDYVTYEDSDANGNFAIEVMVEDNSTTVWSANATNARERISPCTTMPIRYVEDSIPPAVPMLTGTVPAATANNNDPVLSGTTEPGATIRVYRQLGCAGDVAAMAVADAQGAFSVAVHVDDNTSNNFTATAADAAGNVSDCSTGIIYVEDSRIPPTPALEATTVPSSPSNNTHPKITGTAEPNVLVRFYTEATCTTTLSDLTVRADTMGKIELTFDVQRDTTTTVFALAETRVGNRSPCTTTPVTYINDSTPPAPPMIARTDPPSPTNLDPHMVDVSGTTETGSSVRLYSGSGCGGTPLVAPATGVSGMFQFTVPLPSNTTTTLFAQATDAAGNVSACSAPFSFTHDNVAPIAPTLSSTDPASPSNSNTTPTIRGSGEGGAVAKIYLNQTCTGTPAATTTVAANLSFSAQLTVPANATTLIAATLTDAAGNTSVCSGNLSYTHDNTPPAIPTGVTLTPTGPSRTELNPRVKGTAEAGSTVRIFTGGGCSGPPAATGTAEAFGGAGIIVAVSANTTTQIRASARDAAGNDSDCSPVVAYVHDNTPPAVPSALTTVPVSPSATELIPHFKGTAEAGSTVSLFETTDCSGTPIITGTAAEFAADGLPIPTAANTTITVRVTATDAAGNISTCSGPIVYTHDNVAPVAPTALLTVPTSPNNTTPDPKVKGTAEAGSTVKLYAQASCAGAVVGTGTASDFSGAGITATLGANKTSTLTATATDGAGNVSPCSASITYTHNNQPPPAPTNLTTEPPSPSKTDLNPRVKGTVAANVVTVTIYRTGACTGTPAAIASATEFTTTGTPVAALPNLSISIVATATDAAGNVSACSSAITYTHDDTPPPTPALTGTTPASPGGSTTSPLVKGTAEVGATLAFYTGGACTGTPAANGTQADFAGNGIAVPVTPNATTSIVAVAIDAAGNVSPCSAPLSFVHDNIPPAAPTSLVATPASPSNVQQVSIAGTAEDGSTVSIFATADCTGTPLGTGSAAQFATPPGIALTVPPNATTTLRVVAKDAAGNASPCAGATLAFTHDNVPPAAPTIASSTPTSPTRVELNPTLTGTAEANAFVQIFTTPDCSGNASASATAAANGAYTAQVAVTANSTTSFYANARDAAGNTGVCSTPAFTYVHDSLSPDSVVIAPTTNVFKGTTLTCTASGAVGDPITYGYQWRRDGVDIAGATAATYLVAAEDRAHEVKCFANATLGQQTSQFVGSNGVTPVNRAPLAFTSSLTGMANVSSTLTCGGDFVSPDPDGEPVAPQSTLWERSNDGATWTAVAGATTEALTLAAGDLNFSFRCKLTVTDGVGGNTTGAVSNVVGPVNPAIVQGPVACAKPPAWAYWREGMAVGDVFAVTCATSDTQLVPYIVSSSCPSLAFTAAALTGNVPVGSGGCHVTVGARTSGGTVCTGCTTDIVKIRVATQVSNINPCDTPPNPGSDPASFVAYNDGTTDHLFFAAFIDPTTVGGTCADTGPRPFELFLSDGTSAGTRAMTHTIDPAVPTRAQRLGAAMHYNNELYVSVDDVILKTTGNAGTLTVFASAVGPARQLLVHDGSIFAVTDESATDPNNVPAGLKMLSLDGLSKSLVPDTSGGMGQVVTFNGNLYFGFRGQTGTQLTVVTAPYDASNPAGTPATPTAADSLAVFNNKIYFAGSDGTANMRKLMSFDGTSYRVEFGLPAYGSQFQEILGVTVYGAALYFTTTTVETPGNDTYTSLYQIDATGAQKRLVQTITANVIPRKALLPGIEGLLIAAPVTIGQPFTMLSLPTADVATPIIEHYMTGPYWDRATAQDVIGPNQVISFIQIASVTLDDDLVNRAAPFKGEVFFSGRDTATPGFELWKLSDPKPLP